MEIPNLKDGDEIVGMAEFVITTNFIKDKDGKIRPIVVVQPPTDKSGNEPQYEFWMASAEYLLAITAQKSPLGYEKAIEEIVKYAMKYKTKTVKVKKED